MDKSIIINYNPFCMESQFYIYDNGNMKKQYAVASSLDGVVDNVLAISYSNDIYNVKVQGPLSFTNEVKKQVANAEQALYSNQKINIEVM